MGPQSAAKQITLLRDLQVFQRPRHVVKQPLFERLDLVAANIPVRENNPGRQRREAAFSVTLGCDDSLAQTQTVLHSRNKCI